MKPSLKRTSLKLELLCEDCSISQPGDSFSECQYCGSSTLRFRAGLSNESTLLPVKDFCRRCLAELGVGGTLEILAAFLDRGCHSSLLESPYVAGMGDCHVALLEQARSYIEQRDLLAAVSLVSTILSRDPAHVASLETLAGAAIGIDLGNGQAIEMLAVPSGTFSMGSEELEAGRKDDEVLRQVAIPRPFWLGRTEVTQAQWKAVMGDCPSCSQGESLPVEQISWNAAKEFCRRLNELVQARPALLPRPGVFRLPTEAEWEYACRAGSSTPYAGLLDDIGWHGVNSGGHVCPVGGRRPNAWGFQDMHGNVFEWCEDEVGGGLRACRGGSWQSSVAGCRSARRACQNPSAADALIGMRLALEFYAVATASIPKKKLKKADATFGVPKRDSAPARSFPQSPSPPPVVTPEKEGADSLYRQGLACQKGQGVAKDEAAAVKWFRKAASRGMAEAQHQLGWCYANGLGIQKSYSRAAKWYRLAAEQGFAPAQTNLGFCYKEGQGVDKDEMEAVKWFRKAAEQGLAWAQHALGTCYQNGQGEAKDYAAAARWYRKAAEQGLAAGQADLGWCYGQGLGVPRSAAEGLRWMRMAAEQGHAQAQVNLGLLYEQGGDGVPCDHGAAATWFLRAAEQGHATAQNWIGLCHLEGRGVDKDLGRALAWFEKAARQGHPDALYNLGVCYCREGKFNNHAEAVKWFRRAAAQGVANAQKTLGICCFLGQGTRKDVNEAATWIRRAADQGNDEAQFILGLFYKNGSGVARDLAEARRWLQKAATQGREDARAELEKM